MATYINIPDPQENIHIRASSSAPNTMPIYRPTNAVKLEAKFNSNALLAGSPVDTRAAKSPVGKNKLGLI